MRYKGLRKSSEGILVIDGVGKGEPLPSLMCGVPSLAIGLAALVVIASCLIGYPVGTRQLYEVRWFPESTAVAAVTGPVPPGTVVSLALPSPVLLLLLIVGMICGGVGIMIAHDRGAGRQAVTCIAGVIACAAALVLAWISYLAAAAA